MRHSYLRWISLRYSIFIRLFILVSFFMYHSYHFTDIFHLQISSQSTDTWSITPHNAQQIWFYHSSHSLLILSYLIPFLHLLFHFLRTTPLFFTRYYSYSLSFFLFPFYIQGGESSAKATLHTLRALSRIKLIRSTADNTYILT